MSSGSLLPQVERLFGAGTVAGLPEVALLERFLARRDELAFEVLVSRHGPLVLGVCRRLLRDPRDVEDAFQATFLILVRKAGSIQQRELLGPWLYGVAYRVARRSRAVKTRQHLRESELAEHEPPDTPDDPGWAELRSVLDEELARLPNKYREPVVLCYLQGLTHDEAASRLGCPVGTVRSRLARGRERLGVRLVRRGLAPAAGLIGGSLATQTVGKSVPPALSAATTLAAQRFAAGVMATKVVSAESAALLEGVLETMSWKTLGRAALASAAIGVLVVGAFFAGRRSDNRAAEYAALYELRIPKNVKRPTLVSYPAYVVEPPDYLIVEVLDALPGRPIQGEHVVRQDGTISLGFYGDVYVAGLTLPEVKEKIVLHLRNYLNDDALGLWKQACDPGAIQEAKRRRELKYFKELEPPMSPPPGDDPVSLDDRTSLPELPAFPNGESAFAKAEPSRDQPAGRMDRQPEAAPGLVPESEECVWLRVYPKDSDTVYVDVGMYNSKFFYVEGMAGINGRYPCTGKETVLDAIHIAGGLMPLAVPQKMRLIRPGKGDEPDQVFPIDYAAIAYGVDPSTNYQLFPGDRLVVPGDPEKVAEAPKDPRAWMALSHEKGLASRIHNVEKKLDRVISVLNKPHENTAAPRPPRAQDEARKHEVDQELFEVIPSEKDLPAANPSPPPVAK